ncbi:pyridoxal phosphate-dependent aminotransferase family protein [Spirosoma luteolum]
MIRSSATVLDALTDRLLVRQQANAFRSLRVGNTLVDFCSNDYLGFAKDSTLSDTIQQATQTQAYANGATGSRLLAGQTDLADALEAELARFYHCDASLLFNSGYDANIGLMACLPQRGDTLLTDELIHASMIDGARLSYADRIRFRHNDLDDLESKLRVAIGHCFVAVESVYSMDGDFAPLEALCELCDRYGAGLIVDEAHATGVYGPRGEGRVVALNLQERVLARVHTFGKGLGVHGAVVTGSAVLRDYLINFARSFIYTTALPPHSLLAIREAHRYLAKLPDARQTLHQRLAYFHAQRSRHLPHTHWTDSQSPIQCLLVPGNDQARQLAAAGQAAGLDLRAILSPTVPIRQERIRICFHAFNTNEQIDRLCAVLQPSFF